jgi:hypothetical protein
MNVNSGTRRRGKIQRSNSFRFFSVIPRDYLARRELFRKISNVMMIVLFSLIIAGIIVYTSDPTSFSFLRH